MRLSLFALLDGCLAPAPEPERVGWLRGAVFAHRGLHGPDVPENSPGAFAAALADGLGIECDVHLARDGQAVVFHDWELDRLTDRSGPVRALTAAELGAICLTGGASGDTIPTLAAVLHRVGGVVPLLIEIKSRRGHAIAPLCRAVHDALKGYRGPHAVMSFDPRVGHWFRRHAPQTVRGLVVTEENDRGLLGQMRRHAWLWHARPDFLAYDIRDLTGPFPVAQRRRGLPLVTWTVRTPEQLDRARTWADAPTVEGGGLP